MALSPLSKNYGFATTLHWVAKMEFSLSIHVEKYLPIHCAPQFSVSLISLDPPHPIYSEQVPCNDSCVLNRSWIFGRCWSYLLKVSLEEVTWSDIVKIFPSSIVRHLVIAFLIWNGVAENLITLLLKTFKRAMQSK